MGNGHPLYMDGRETNNKRRAEIGSGPKGIVHGCYLECELFSESARSRVGECFAGLQFPSGELPHATVPLM